MLSFFRAKQAPAAPPSSRLGDLSAVPDFWYDEEGFHHPNWPKITKLVELRASGETEREAAWHHASVQWLNRLTTEMGSGFRLGESQNFLLSSAKSNLAVRFFLGQCESALASLRARLGPAAWRWKHGKHAVLMFEDEDAYYRYVAHFYPKEGEYGLSSGMYLLGRGYCHTALAPSNNALPTLVHELTHLCLTPWPLPKWLEEGLATSLERQLTGHGARTIDRESIVRQRAYWDRDRIQRFWTGESFRVGDEREFSYSLAEHLVTLLAREFRGIGEFVRAARWEDAGQAAAREHFDLDLSDIAAAFLGEGDWQPRPAEQPKDDGEPPPP